MGEIKSLYLSGPMRGRPLFNFPAFHEATAFLREKGYEVFSPAEMDEEDGFDPASAVFTTEGLRKALKRDTETIFKVDAVAVLPGWEASRGARLEVELALMIGLPVINAYTEQALTYGQLRQARWESQTGKYLEAA